MKMIVNRLCAPWALAILLACAPAALAGTPPGPDDAIRAATANLLGIVDRARGYFDSDPERYYAEVDAVIGPVVDFYSFSRGVMGRWGSKAYYDALATDEQKKHYDAQVARFTKVFRQGLVRTYSKGLLAFSGETIEVQPALPAEVAQGLATVVQTIHGRDGKRYEIRYKMRRDPDRQWRVRNVSLDTLNLGKVYQSQFASAAGRFQGNIDQVIDNWSVVPETGAAR